MVGCSLGNTTPEVRTRRCSRYSTCSYGAPEDLKLGGWQEPSLSLRRTIPYKGVQLRGDRNVDVSNIVEASTKCLGRPESRQQFTEHGGLMQRRTLRRKDQRIRLAVQDARDKAPNRLLLLGYWGTGGEGVRCSASRVAQRETGGGPSVLTLPASGVQVEKDDASAAAFLSSSLARNHQSVVYSVPTPYKFALPVNRSTTTSRPSSTRVLPYTQAQSCAPQSSSRCSPRPFWLKKYALLPRSGPSSHLLSHAVN
jgi:hypothetical protein